jgi:protein-S-isoprenylcysteine O-methyltransferase Ste14
MRNPIRFKNFGRRYLVWYLLGLIAIVLSRPTATAFAAGLLCVAIGAALRSWGAGHLVKNERLTISGPYAHLRHPLYSGTLLVGVGFGIIAGGWLTAAILPLIAVWFFASYFPRKERSESAKLAQIYGDAFTAYRAAVPALVPALSAWRPGQLASGLGDPDLRWSFARYSANNELGTLIALAAGLTVLGARTHLGA